jgi:hypothetical protein
MAGSCHRIKKTTWFNFNNSDLDEKGVRFCFLFCGPHLSLTQWQDPMAGPCYHHYGSGCESYWYFLLFWLIMYIEYLSECTNSTLNVTITVTHYMGLRDIDTELLFHHNLKQWSLSVLSSNGNKVLKENSNLWAWFSFPLHS